MIYCDASFIVAIYSDEGPLSEKARLIAARWTDAPMMSAFTELEVVNTFHRKAFVSPEAATEVTHWIRRFESDCRDGIFTVSHGNPGVILRDARELSLRHTPGGGYRSLDLLHIAAAKMLGAKTFLSFDARLNVLAKKEKIKVLP